MKKLNIILLIISFYSFPQDREIIKCGFYNCKQNWNSISNIKELKGNSSTINIKAYCDSIGLYVEFRIKDNQYLDIHEVINKSNCDELYFFIDSLHPNSIDSCKDYYGYANSKLTETSSYFKVNIGNKSPVQVGMFWFVDNLYWSNEINVYSFLEKNRFDDYIKGLIKYEDDSVRVLEWFLSWNWIFHKQYRELFKYVPNNEKRMSFSIGYFDKDLDEENYLLNSLTPNLPGFPEINKDVWAILEIENKNNLRIKNQMISGKSSRKIRSNHKTNLLGQMKNKRMANTAMEY